MRERCSIEFELERLGIGNRAHPNRIWAKKLGWDIYLDQIVGLLGLKFTPASVSEQSFIHAVKQWQLQNGIENPDGIIGPKTWKKMSLGIRPNPKSTLSTIKMDGGIRISFTRTSNASTVSDYSLQIIKEILQKAQLNHAVITSTTRTPGDQARIMFNNCEKYGVSAQKELYGRYGDMVIDVYLAGKESNKDAKSIIQEMTRKIINLGPANVSRHCGDPKIVNVIDIAPSSIPEERKQAFISAIESEQRIRKFLQPPKDPAYHIEIVQPKTM